MSQRGLWVYLVLVFLCCSLFANETSGATCGRYQSAVEQNKLSFPRNPHYSPDRKYFGAPAVCDQLASNKTFYIPLNGTSKEDVEQMAFAQGFGLGALAEECRIPATKLLCASAFRECQYEPIAEALPNFFVFPLPRPPCKSLCEDMVKGCKGLGVPLPNCSEIDSTINQPSYPSSRIKFVVAGQSFLVPCESYREIRDLDKLQLDPVACPYPLEYNEDHHSEDPPCQVVCPHANTYSEEEWSNVVNIKMAFAIISVTLDAFTLLTLITIKDKRHFPANLGIVATTVHLLWMIILLTSTIIGLDTVDCKNRFEISDSFNHPFCGVEAAAMYWAGSIVAYLWMFLAINLFVYVVLEMNESQVKHYWIPTYVLSIGFPTIATAVLWPLNQFGYYLQFPWCWVLDERTVAVFWIYIFSAVIISTFCMIASVGKLIKVKRRLMSIKRALMKHVNILLFLLSFLLVYGFHSGNWLWLHFHGGELYDNAVAQRIVCNSQSGGRNDCVLTDRYAPATLYFYTAVTSGSGLIIFAAWGCSLKYIGHWRRVFETLFQGDIKGVWDLSLSRTATVNSSSRASAKRALSAQRRTTDENTQ